MYDAVSSGRYSIGRGKTPVNSTYNAEPQRGDTAVNRKTHGVHRIQFHIPEGIIYILLETNVLHDAFLDF